MDLLERWSAIPAQKSCKSKLEKKIYLKNSRLQEASINCLNALQHFDFKEHKKISSSKTLINTYQ